MFSHLQECGYTTLLYKAELGAWWLAYRALTKLPWKYYRDHWEEFGGRQEKAGLGEAVWSSMDPLSLHRLVSHDGSQGKQPVELMMQAHVVVFLLRLLIATGYLEESEHEEELGEEATKAAMLLHHFMRVTFYNSHEVTEVQKTGPGWGDNSLRKIGRVTNPSLALINHSCDPNYDRVSMGRITLGFACKPIGAGEQIMDTYCQPFVAMGREERRERLARYNFICECEACSENWPGMDSMEGSLEGLSENRYRVSRARVGQGLTRVAQAEKEVEQVMRNPREAVVAVCKLLEELHSLVKPPHQALTYWESLLCELLLHIHSSKVETHCSSSSKLLLPPSTL